MLSALIISLREGLEAALIVGIVLSCLRQFDNKVSVRYVWIGVSGAVAASFALAIGIQSVGAELEGKSEAIFEGITMILAAGMLIWMIFWMRSHAKTLKSEIARNLSSASIGHHFWGIAGVTFLAVFREGVETALFLSAASFTSNALATWTGAAIGLGLAALGGYLIFTSALRFNLRVFFNITSIILLVFAGIMLVSGIHELEEAGIVNALLSNEMLEQVLLYVLYGAVILGGLRWWERRQIQLPSD